MTASTVEFILNGRPAAVATDPARKLVDVLRDDLGLTGTKQGCDYEGQCGACTVIVDGRAVRSCLLTLGSVAGKHVTTIEGVAGPGGLHPLQQAFIDAGAVQCGYCTPGMIMAAKALLDQNPDPTPDQVGRALNGNLCRCTGYTRIVDAVLAAAAVLRGEPQSDVIARPGRGASALAAWSTRSVAPAGPKQSPSCMDREGDCSPARHRTPCGATVTDQVGSLQGALPHTVIGGDYRRGDAAGKVTGQTRFAGDMRMPGMLYAKVLRSPHAHARLLSIDASAALAMPGVEAVLTAADIPGVKAFSDAWAVREQPGESDAGQMSYEPVLAVDRVRMVGEPVAIVVASEEAIAAAALAKVQVSYELLEPVLDPEPALQPESPQLHDSGNLYEYAEIKVAGGGAAAPAPVEVTTHFEIPGREHAALEPESMVSYLDEDGRVVVIGPTHQPHMRRHMIAEMLAIPADQVRVITPPLGGSFGKRHHYWPVVAAALPAYLLRRPVQFTYTRREVFEATPKDHPFRLAYHISATPEGRLVGLHARALGDAGPYGGAPGLGAFVALCGTGPYRWQTVDYEARVAHTNGANSGPMRGYGMQHGTLGLECSLDELAARLNMDPWDLRMANAADDTSGTCTGQDFEEPFGFKQTLEAIKADWDEMRAAVRQARSGASENGSERHGAGLAASWYQFGKAGKLSVSAQSELGLDGRITLYFCAPNSGQGLDTVMSQLAAAELGIERSRIDLVNGDSDSTLDTHVYGACKSTYWIGGAVVEAARVLRHVMLSTASEMLDSPPDRLSMGDGVVFCAQDPGRRVSFAAIAAELERLGLGPRKYTGTFELEGVYRKSGRAPYLGHFSCGTAAAEVAVDVKSGKVRVCRVVVAQDVGKAINPVDVRGQIEGSVVMDIGAALSEAYRAAEITSFRQYRIPRAASTPAIKTILVEAAAQHGPHGAKGVGEAAVGHVRAAVLNAIYDAVGVRVRRLPATPERILEALRRAGGELNSEAGNYAP